MTFLITGLKSEGLQFEPGREHFFMLLLFICFSILSLPFNSLLKFCYTSFLVFVGGRGGVIIALYKRYTYQTYYCSTIRLVLGFP